MSDFGLYLQLGFEHITDLEGFDHMLFLLALCAAYTLRDLKRVLVLVTAFTLGHSLTLALSIVAGRILKTNTVETLILVTIVAAAVLNLLRPPVAQQKAWPQYLLALFFGLIHGMGFSNYLRAILGWEESIVRPLLAFNLGLELGQILVVTIVLLITHLVVFRIGLRQRWWTAGISVLAGGWAVYAIVYGQ
jgi:hypothetical protein